MSQSVDQTAVSSAETQVPDKSSWGRTMALTGVALFVAGLFLGGLFKGSETGTTIIRVVSFGGVGCPLVGLIGVGLDAIKKKSAKSSD